MRTGAHHADATVICDDRPGKAPPVRKRRRCSVTRCLTASQRWSNAPLMLWRIIAVDPSRECGRSANTARRERDALAMVRTIANPGH